MNNDRGRTKSYILNLMVHDDWQLTNEYTLRPRINKRFKTHLRSKEVFNLHIKPLLERNWIEEVKREFDGETIIEYRRVGPLRRVRAEETLFPRPLEEGEYDGMDMDDFIASHSNEKEFQKYVDDTYADSYREYLKQNRKLTKEEEQELDNELAKDFKWV